MVTSFPPYTFCPFHFHPGKSRPRPLLPFHPLYPDPPSLF
jgi:hypothetical protein